MKESRINSLIFLAIIVFTIVIRYPYFQIPVLNWDESTFIIVGKAWNEGLLPYTYLWDLKQPILFYFFKACIFLFGENLAMIRFSGALLIAISAFYLYLIGKNLSGSKEGIIASMLYVLFITTFEEFGIILSEHIALVFLIPAVYYLISAKENRFLYVAAGVFLGFTCFVRLNLCTVVLLLGLFQLFRPGGFLKNTFRTMLIGIGFTIASLVCIYPYLKINQIDVWWESIVMASLSYSNHQEIKTEELESQLVLILIFVIVGCLTYYLKKYKNIQFRFQDNWNVILITILGIEIGLLKSGKLFDHYLIQILPFLCIVGIHLIQLLLKSFHVPEIRLKQIFIIVIFGFSIYNYINAYDFKNDPDPTQFLVNYLNKNLKNKDKVYLMDRHIIYFWIDKWPMSMASTHPSNITRDYLFPYMDEKGKTTLEKIKGILNQNPRYILTENKVWYLNDYPNAQKFLSLTLKKKYKPLFYTSDGLILFEKRL